MKPDRDRQLARFRANLHARVKEIIGQLEVLECVPTNPDASRQVQGELHTFKGESRLLGLVALSDLAHAMESHLGQAHVDFERLSGVMNAVRVALSENTSATTLETTATELQAFFPEQALAPADEPAPHDASVMEPADADLVPSAAHSNEEAVVEEPHPSIKASRRVQVDAHSVDDLCEDMSVLVTKFGSLRALGRRLSSAAGGALDQATLQSSLDECADLLSRCMDRTWSLRLVPVEPMLLQLRRHAELQAKRSGKEVRVLVESGSAQLERDVVDQMWDALVHLVQNAVTHGIENPGDRENKPRAATLVLSAESQGPRLCINVADDGRGIDLDAVRNAAVSAGRLTQEAALNLDRRGVCDLIFDHGLSTRENVDELSGRGVGLSVVRSKVLGLGGTVDVETQAGQGTRFTLTVPFTITKERVLVIDAGDGLYGIPSRVVRSVLGTDDLVHTNNNGQELIRVDGDFVPLRSLRAALGLSAAPQEPMALLLTLGGRLFGARVPRVLGEQELVRRPADKLLSRTTGIGASATTEDGQLVLLPEFGFLQRGLSRKAGPSIPDARREPRSRINVLVVDDSPVVTAMVAELLTSEGFSVRTESNGARGLVAIEESPPHLVISDVEMPQMGGLELLSAIRTRWATLPVVMLTTRGSVEDRQEASRRGANAYVLKSDFRSDVLLSVVRRFLPDRS